jgi:hypothetical protein
MLSFTIDKNDWTRGISITAEHGDGGFSPFRRGHNLELAQGGILYPQPARQNLNGGSVVVDNIIAFTADPSYLGNMGYALDEGGNFYTISGTTVTKRQTDAVKTYTLGTSNIKTFGGSLFATSTTDIAKLDNSNLTVIDNDWWTTTQARTALDSSYRHPMEVVEDTLYIADKNMIHTWDGTTSVYNAFSLPTTLNITSLIVHTDGRHILAFCAEVPNYSHSSRAKAKVFFIDTVNLEFVREVDIDAQVEGVINVGGVLYCTFGNNLGYFNGDGLTFLRKLGSTTTYSHNLANKEGILVVRDTEGMLFYGNLGLGNVFWYGYSAFQSPSQNLTSIFYAGDNTMLISAQNRLLDLIDFDTCADECQWESNSYSFPGKVWIRKILVETETLATGSDMTFYYVNKNGSTSQIMTLSYSADGAISEKQGMVNVFTDLFRLRVAFTASNTKGIRKITIFYEDGE